MAFPFTHLCVAWRVLEKLQNLDENHAAAFLLGSLAPDAVHYRKGYVGAGMAGIGAAKKISHLCPVSDEKWGQVTDNGGWVKCVRNFLATHSTYTGENCWVEANCFTSTSNENAIVHAFVQGYAAHVLTDIHNNRTLWDTFRAKYPEEAAKGYASEYYADLKEIHTRLFLEFPATTEIMALLAKAVPVGIPGLVTAEEVRDLQENILHVEFKDARIEAPRAYKFTTYDDTLNYIESAATFCTDFFNK